MPDLRPGREHARPRTPGPNLLSYRYLYALLPRPLQLIVLCAGGGALLLHLWANGWFLAHSEISEATVLGRKDYAFIGRKHGFSRLEVCYHDGSGEKLSAAIDWNLTAAPQGDTVLIRRADSGMIRAAPASLAEVMWFEVWAIIGCLVFGAFALIALSVAKARNRRKSLRSPAGNPFTKTDEPDRQA